MESFTIYNTLRPRYPAKNVGRITDLAGKELNHLFEVSLSGGRITGPECSTKICREMDRLHQDKNILSFWNLKIDNILFLKLFYFCNYQLSSKLYRVLQKMQHSYILILVLRQLCHIPTLFVLLCCAKTLVKLTLYFGLTMNPERVEPSTLRPSYQAAR